MEIIEFKNVSHDPILKNITGCFRASRITTFVGPSGAGKTTCLKHINRLLSPTSGEVLFKGNNIETLDVIELRKSIGMAFQSSPMIEGTVYDNLNLPKAIFNETLSEARARELLMHMDLGHIDLKTRVKSLSGGERSRVAIARTLVNEPEVLLLDEITASLDYRLVREVEHLIKRIRNEYGVTVIWITHDMEQARRVSDDIWFLKNGELLDYGSLASIESSSNFDVVNYLNEVDA